MMVILFLIDYCMLVNVWEHGYLTQRLIKARLPVDDDGDSLPNRLLHAS
jgi:hypothetical protein